MTVPPDIRLGLTRPGDPSGLAVSLSTAAADARLSVVERGFVAAGTATGVEATDTATLQAFATALAGGNRGIIPPGNYRCTAGAFQPPDNAIILAHKNAKITFVGSAHGVGFGSPDDITPDSRVPLTVNATRGGTTVTVSIANAANFSAGMRVYQRDTDTLGGIEYRKQPNVVKSVNLATGVITLEFPNLFAYDTTKTAEIAPVTGPQNVHWYGGQIDMSGVAAGASDYNGFNLQHGDDCSVNDTLVLNHPNKAVEMYASIGCVTRFVRSKAPSADGAGQGYGVRMAHSIQCAVLGGRGQNLRHTVDIAGGAWCEVTDVKAVGRTPSGGSQTSYLIHGLNGYGHSFKGCYSINQQVGFGAGNGTFGADFDFTATDMHMDSCDIGVSILQGCSGFEVEAKAVNSADRAAAFADCTNWKALINGDGQQSGTNALITVSGNCDGGVLKPRFRNAAGNGVSATHSGGSLVVELPDGDMGTSALVGITASITSGATMTVRAGRVKMNSISGTASGIDIRGTSGCILTVDGTEIAGVWVRGVVVGGGSGDATVRGVKFAATGSVSEQIRVETGTSAKIHRNEFANTGTSVRLNTTGTVDFLDNIWQASSGTRINNGAGATITGNPRKEFWSSASPTPASGNISHQVADVAWNSGVAAAGVPGWVCTTGSSPGPSVWKAMAAVAA